MMWPWVDVCEDARAWSGVAWLCVAVCVGGGHTVHIGRRAGQDDVCVGFRFSARALLVGRVSQRSWGGATVLECSVLCGSEAG